MRYRHPPGEPATSVPLRIADSPSYRNSHSRITVTRVITHILGGSSLSYQRRRGEVGSAGFSWLPEPRSFVWQIASMRKPRLIKARNYLASGSSNGKGNHLS